MLRDPKNVLPPDRSERPIGDNDNGRALSMVVGATRGLIEGGTRLALAGWSDGDDHRVGVGNWVGKILPALK